jgi:hypothetical protein
MNLNSPVRQVVRDCTSLIFAFESQFTGGTVMAVARNAPPETSGLVNFFQGTQPTQEV